MIAIIISVAPKHSDKPYFPFRMLYLLVAFVRDVRNVFLSVDSSSVHHIGDFCERGRINSACDGRSSASPSQTYQPTNATPTVQFDVSNLQSSYANVCNVSSTREEVVLT